MSSTSVALGSRLEGMVVSIGGENVEAMAGSSGEENVEGVVRSADALPEDAVNGAVVLSENGRSG